MTDNQIKEFVKKLEPFFIGFTAEERSLKNSNGMELLFYADWNDKTTVSGLHAKHRYSIGCSFEKPLDKIFKDIRRRLMPDYYADFFESKREKIERAEFDELQKQKLRALASVLDGEISKDYGRNYSGNSEYVSANNVSIYQTYKGNYEFHLELDYIGSMKVAKYLKEFYLVNPDI